jgi:hypothetical protein
MPPVYPEMRFSSAEPFVDVGHGVDKRLAFLFGIGVVCMHVFEELPGIVADHSQYVHEPLVALGINIQVAGAKCRQGTADEVGQGEADCNFLIMLLVPWP